MEVDFLGGKIGTVMSYLKRIVCLANSRKLSGRCVAGKELSPGLALGEWIRPVRNRPKQELSSSERRYDDGTEPQLLDVVELRLEEHVPHAPQMENHRIASACCWMKGGAVTWKDLDAVIDASVRALWIDGYSSYNGQDDRIPEGEARETR
jgi:hypothetical protein